MRYRVTAPMNFVDDTAPRRDGMPALVTLEAGVVVDTLTIYDLSPQEARDFERMERTAQRQDHNVRLVCFRWAGKFRTAVVGRHVRPVMMRMGREV